MARRGKANPGHLTGRWLSGPQLTPDMISLDRDRLLIPKNVDGLVGETITPQNFEDAFELPPPDPPDPPTPGADIKFGALTLSQFGGEFLDLPDSPTITGTGAADWTAFEGCLVPSGTWGAVKTFSLSSYSLTIEGVAYTITIEPGYASWTATSIDTATSNQIQKTLLVRGKCTLKGRDCWFNPHGQLWRFNTPTTGDARVVLTSHNPNSGVDAYGNLKDGGGAVIGSLTLNVSNTTDTEVPWDIEYVSFMVDVDEPHTNMIGASNTSFGWGWNVRHCTFEFGNDVSTANCKYGVVIRGGDCSYNWARHCLNSYTGGHPTGAHATTFTNNTSLNCLSDDFQTVGQGNIQLENNFSFDPWCAPGAHADHWQHIVGAGKTCSNLSATNEIAVLNTITGMNAGKQGFLISDNTLAVTGVVNTNAIIITGAPIGIASYLASGAQVVGALVCRPYGVSAAFIADSSILFNTPSGGSVVRSVANEFTTPGMTRTNCVELDTQVEVTTAFPNFPVTANPDLTTRAKVKTAATPANLVVASGGVKLGDGSFAGPLNNSGVYQ